MIVVSHYGGLKRDVSLGWSVITVFLKGMVSHHDGVSSGAIKRVGLSGRSLMAW